LVYSSRQVYEILSGWVELRDWEAVLSKVIPLRKFTIKPDRRKRIRRGEEGYVEGAEEGSDEEMLSGEEEGNEEERRGKNATVVVPVAEETEEEEQERLNG